jgi:glycosyltransferase involved in cell wall biosynthesis
MVAPVTVYVDVTSTIQTESMTGIQRVTTEVLGRLINTPLADVLGLQVVPIAWTHWLRRWRRVPIWEFARGPGQALTRRRLWWNRARKLVARRQPIEPGTVFFDLDAAWQSPLRRAELLPALHADGVHIANLHYDLTPVLFPEFFATTLLAVFEDFVRAHETYAERILCISSTVEAALIEHAGRPLPTTVVTLGVDHLRPEREGPADGARDRRTLVHVGTVEPRKGIDTIIDAFEMLVDEFDDVDLLLVGRQGWKAERIASRIRGHALYGKRLRWVDGANDERLVQAYAAAFCVLVASRYEGYGLPVAEALARGCVVISTDGGALGEVAPGLVDHVAVGDGAALGRWVRAYLTDGERWEERRQAVRGWVVPSWDHCARQVGDALVETGRSRQ